MELQPCPHCGNKTRHHLNSEVKENDYTVCLYCGEPLVYVKDVKGDLVLHPLPVGWLETLKSTDPQAAEILGVALKFAKAMSNNYQRENN